MLHRYAHLETLHPFTAVGGLSCTCPLRLHLPMGRSTEAAAGHRGNPPSKLLMKLNLLWKWVVCDFWNLSLVGSLVPYSVRILCTQYK